MVGACTSSDVVLVCDARVGYNFTVWVQSFFMFNFLFCFIRCLFAFLFWLCPFLIVSCCVLGFSFDLFVFRLVSIKLEKRFQKKKRKKSRFNLGLFRFEYRGTFLFMLLVLWH